MAKKTQPQPTEVRTRRVIVHLLKQAGAMDAAELSSRLGISAMAVRQHLYALQAERLVTYQEEARNMGRPAKLWQLTPAANRLFPDGYAELTLSFIQSVVEAFGEAGLERLLEIRTRQQMEAYGLQMEGQESIEQRLQILAEIRTNEGYMAEVQPQADGSFLLAENHCPICAAATACTGLCSKELEVFQSALGENAVVERTEHIVAGARRCAYQVSAKVKSSK